MSESIYETLTRKAHLAVEAMRLEEAQQLYEQALAEAREKGNEVLVDRAYCNVTSVRIAQGSWDGATVPLREILMRNSDPVNCRLAAYNIALIYEHRREPKKGMFYARIAQAQAEHCPSMEPSWAFAHHNQVGNFLVADSHFQAALEKYRAAIAADPKASTVRRAFVWQNMGYCLLVLGKHREGFEHLFRSLRVFRREKVERQIMQTHLDLCFGYLEIDRYDRAGRHGRVAFELARELDERECLKKALYLLGEAENLIGRPDRARDYFDQLQRYFPDAPFVSDFLLAFDVRKMINLRA